MSDHTPGPLTLQLLEVCRDLVTKCRRIVSEDINQEDAASDISEELTRIEAIIAKIENR